MDWAAFADAWRARYRPSMHRVMQGTEPWTALDVLHRQSLDALLRERGINERFTEEEKERLNHVWHRLLRLSRCDAWAHAPAPTLQAGHTVQWQHRAARWIWPGTAPCRGTPILSAELAHAYKPDPRVYQLAITLLSLQSHEVMLVAAHQEDLRAAQAQGMQAAFVPRPLEHGPQPVPDLAPDPAFQIVATDLSRFGASRSASRASASYLCVLVCNKRERLLGQLEP